MAQAGIQRSIRVPLSAIIKDSTVRAAFERAERDQGPEPLAAVITTPRQPQSLSGASCLVEA